MSNNNNNKMPSYADLLSSISSDRREFVYKIYYEIISNSVSITNDTYNDNSSEIPEREVRKTTFLSLVTETNKLLENEKEFCKERYIYEFELSKAIHKSGEPKECSKCKLTRYIVKIVFLYIYKNFSILGHLEMILLITLFKNVRNSHLFQDILWNGSRLIDLKMLNI